MDFSSPAAVRLRALGQRLGVLRPLVRMYRHIFRSTYEERFDRALHDAIRGGDTVWDVGANVGLYTERFAAKVGVRGCVLAFEPSSRNLVRLHERLPAARTVVVCPVGLGAERKAVSLYINEADDGTTDGLVARSPGAVTHQVEIRRGDDYLAEYPPQVIKIDVEGFELEVVQGLHDTLRSPNLRAILIEVHFQTLNQRGLPGAPAQIVQMLCDAGFAVAWVDPSHLVARRMQSG